MAISPFNSCPAALANNFLEVAKTYGRIVNPIDNADPKITLKIISEVALPVNKKTIKPASFPGTAGFVLSQILLQPVFYFRGREILRLQHIFQGMYSLELPTRVVCA